jgi:membrane-bound lytic murein transglycosylase B
LILRVFPGATARSRVAGVAVGLGVLFLAACATQTSSLKPSQALKDLPAPAPGPATAKPKVPNPGLLAKVPQPPERPVAPPAVTDPAIPREQRIAAFVDYTANTYGIAPDHIRAVLAQAEYKQSIIDAITRPAEAVKPWREYRLIFMNPGRIDGGIAFYRDNRAALEKVSAQTGVPAEYVVAIIGVETSYGRNTGSYRVIDALYTLAFDHPKRAPFFAGELAQLFALTNQERQLDVLTLKGSYAGAMGMGQFMPSSYRLWAKDGDGDGRRDLLTHKPDVFASIANYFAIHGWQAGGPVVARASRDTQLPEFVPETVDPIYSLSALAERGYRPVAGEPLPAEPTKEGATVINFDGEAGREYWLGYRNFYVITRYNRSPMYALAVHQLAQTIRAGVDAASGAAGGR